MFTMQNNVKGDCLNAEVTPHHALQHGYGSQCTLGGMMSLTSQQPLTEYLPMLHQHYQQLPQYHAQPEEQHHQLPNSVRVKRPLNEFMLWSRQQRKKITYCNRKMHHSEISKLLGAQWKRMSEADKKPFIDNAKRLRDVHMHQHLNYQYKPKRQTKSFAMKQEKYPMGAGVLFSTNGCMINDPSTQEQWAYDYRCYDVPLMQQGGYGSGKYSGGHCSLHLTQPYLPSANVLGTGPGGYVLPKSCASSSTVPVLKMGHEQRVQLMEEHVPEDITEFVLTYSMPDT